ncbi:MAG: hypothetical protein WCS01_17155 [bacterium]
MGNTWVTNVLHYLDEDGQFAVKSGPARRMAEYTGSIIEAVTSRPAGDDDWVTAIQCRRRPGRVRCLAPIIAGYWEEDPTTIVWGCPACKDEGYISGWQETLWDRRKFLYPR